MEPPPPHPPPIPAPAHLQHMDVITNTVNKKRTRQRHHATRRDLLPEAFLQDFALPSGGELGRGAFAIVRKCVNYATGEECAAKIIDLRPLKMKENVKMERVLREVSILKTCRHPNIVELRAVYQNEDTLVIIMELVVGRELFFSILERNHFTEHDFRPIFLQLAEALRYLHDDLHIVHRDVKPENVLIVEGVDYHPPSASVSSTTSTTASAGSSSSPSSSASSSPTYMHSTTRPLVKLLDFGLSKLVDPAHGGSAPHTFVGTRAYLAPEVELIAHGQGQDYGCPSDCWSLGAVMHVALVAKFPEFDVIHRIVDKKSGIMTPFSGVLKVEGLGLWDHLSEAAKDLIKRLMTPNPEKRMTAAQALNHPWARGMSELGSFYAPKATAGLAGSSHHHHHHQQQHPHRNQSAIAAIGAHSTLKPDSFIHERGGGTGGVGGDGNGKGMHTHKSNTHNHDHNSHNNHNKSSHHHNQHNNDNGHSNSNGATSSAIKPAGKSGGSNSSTTTSTVPHVALDPIAAAPVELRLGLLVKIQQWVATALGVAFHLMVTNSSKTASEVAFCVRTGAVVCRHELHLTVKLLRKVQETAALVLSVFPDLTLALKEGELVLAQSFFCSIKAWLSEIRKEVQEVQRSNEQATIQMSRLIKKAARELVGSHKLIQYRERERRKNQAGLCQQQQEQEQQQEQGQEQQEEGGEGEGGTGTAEEGHKRTCRGLEGSSPRKGKVGGLGGLAVGEQENGHDDDVGQQQQQQQQHGQAKEGKRELDLEDTNHNQDEGPLTDEQILESLLPSVHCDEETYPVEGDFDKKVNELAQVLNDLLPAEAIEPLRLIGESPGATRQLEDRQISQVIICLQRLDRILERLDCFWARCESDLDLMVKRADHIRNLISNARSPETVGRLNGRLAEYATFWSRVQQACQRYLNGVSESTVALCYNFLDNDEQLPQPDCQNLGNTAYHHHHSGGGVGGSHATESVSNSLYMSGDSTVGELSNDEGEAFA